MVSGFFNAKNTDLSDIKKSEELIILKEAMQIATYAFKLV